MKEHDMKEVFLVAMISPWQGDLPEGAEVWSVNRAYQFSMKTIKQTNIEAEPELEKALPPDYRAELDNHKADVRHTVIAFQNEHHHPQPGLTRAFFFDNPRKFSPEFMTDMVELGEKGVRLIGRKAWPEFPTCEAYPKDEIVKSLGTDYFTCTVAYMLAMAIHEGFEKINCVGMYHLHDSIEYMHHKGCVEFWVGYARGKGIEVNMIGGTQLLQPFPWQGHPYGYRCNRNEKLSISTIANAYQATLHYPISEEDADVVDAEELEAKRLKQEAEAAKKEAPQQAVAAEV